MSKVFPATREGGPANTSTTGSNQGEWKVNPAVYLDNPADDSYLKPSAPGK